MNLKIFSGDIMMHLENVDIRNNMQNGTAKFKQKQAVQIDPEVAQNMDAFATMVLTDSRLEQGAMAVAGGNLEFSMKLIGQFLAWIGKDVQTETVSELEASGLEWKQVSGIVQRQAREWYIKKYNEL